MSSSENKRSIKFSTSFSTSLRGNQLHDFEESFKVGDFSSKHFRKSSVFTQRSLPQEPEEVPEEADAQDLSSSAIRIEGGFEEKPDLSNSIKVPAHKKNSTSGLSNLISSSMIQDSSVLNDHSMDRSARNQSSASIAFNALDALSDARLRSTSPSPFRRPSNAQVDTTNPDQSTVDAIARHLVTEDDVLSLNSHTNSSTREDFDPIQLQGGDISREVYNWQKEHSHGNAKRRRSHSFSGSVSGSITEPAFQVHDIRVPGGFRRSFLIQKASNSPNILEHPPTFFTRNFIEFLTLYGHFAGEELRDEDDLEDYNDVNDNDEESLLLSSVNPNTRRQEKHKTTSIKAVMLLLKAFIGTGVLFLPRGFRNAGWVFSLASLTFFSIISYWCFMLLINVRVHIGAASYGDVGGQLYGSWMRKAILASIVLSQIGFAAAYIVFTATNLQAFFTSIAHLTYGLEFYILIQLIIFIPLSLTRKISKLSGTALVADLFIFIGLLYVYYYCSFVVISEGHAPVKAFNEDWSVFVGTAIFTYEGIGLLIPIQESMQKPSKFPILLGWVLFAATLIFVSAGSVGYFAFGQDTETVILLNFPQDSVFVSVVQFLYSIAILLSTPLQLFPAIRILENGLIKKSGKYDSSIKWQKNYFRIFIVVGTALLAWGGASDLDKFVAIVGSFACIPLIYVFPPLLHYKSMAKTMPSKALDIVVTCFGVLMMTYTSAQTVSQWIS